MTFQSADLAALGWTPYFNAQTTFDELSALCPVRVMAVHRGQLAVLGDGVDALIPSHMPDAQSEEDYPTVGDWLLIDRETLIAANVDTLFIVSSCNQDFNLARIERYLVLAKEAGVQPVIVLTKSDLAPAPEDFAAEARRLQPGLLVETVNALEPDSLGPVRAWCGKGQTVALMGSSGVGKSTLINTLTGAAAATQSIRADDAKGRHTTTGRALHRLHEGGWLIDTPGMRELQLTDASAGIDDVFEDIAGLAHTCRFSDCAHESEPGCAVQAAIDAGTLDAQRLGRWRKLVAEEAFNSQTLAQRRASDKAFGKMVRSTVQHKRKGDWK